MSQLQESQREELQTMRDTIITRMDELQRQVDFGELTDNKRYEQLQEEFGYDYLQTLAHINELLHAQHQQEHIVPRTLIASVLGLFLFGLAISTALTLSPTGYTILGDQEVIQTNIFVQAQATQRLELPEKTVITAVELSTPTTLILEDAHRKRVLYTDNRCVGCGQNIQAPYIITNDGDKHTTIQTITVAKT